MVYRKIVGFGKSESVTAFICGMGRLNYKRIIALAHVTLSKSLREGRNRVLKTLCASHIVSSGFSNLCCEYDVSYGSIIYICRRFVNYRHLRKFKSKISDNDCMFCLPRWRSGVSHSLQCAWPVWPNRLRRSGFNSRLRRLVGTWRLTKRIFRD